MSENLMRLMSPHGRREEVSIYFSVSRQAAIGKPLLRKKLKRFAEKFWLFPSNAFGPFFFVLILEKGFLCGYAKANKVFF